MYPVFLFLHSIFRWLVLLSLLLVIYRAWKGYATEAIYTKTEDSVRHWTATISHIQLIIGFTLYLVSPLVEYFLGHSGASHGLDEFLFFGVVHIALMLIAIVVITIGSSLAKRRKTDPEKFKTQLLWFSVGLLLILLAIPWPFSPLAQRPYFRVL